MKFKVGDKVSISEAERKWLRQTAWDTNKIPNKGIVDEDQAKQYFTDMAIGNGFRYDAKIIGFSDHAKNFLVRFTVAGIVKRAWFDPKDLRKPGAARGKRK